MGGVGRLTVCVGIDRDFLKSVFEIASLAWRVLPRAPIDSNKSLKSLFLWNTLLFGWPVTIFVVWPPRS